MSQEVEKSPPDEKEVKELVYSFSRCVQDTPEVEATSSSADAERGAGIGPLANKWKFSYFRELWRKSRLSEKANPEIEERERTERLLAAAMDCLIGLDAGEGHPTLAEEVGAIYAAYAIYETQNPRPRSCIYVSFKEIDCMIHVLEQAERLNLPDVHFVSRRLLNKGAFMPGCVQRPTKKEVVEFEEKVERIHRSGVHQVPEEVRAQLEKLRESVEGGLAAVLNWDEMARLGTTYMQKKSALLKKLPEGCSWMAKRTFRLPKDLETVHETCVEEVNAAMRGINTALISSERRVNHKLRAAEEQTPRRSKRPTQLQRKALSTAAYMMKSAHGAGSDYHPPPQDARTSDSLEWLDNIFGLPKAARMAVRVAEQKRRRSLQGRDAEPGVTETQLTTHQGENFVDQTAQADAVQLPRLMSMPSIPGLPERVQSPPPGQQLDQSRPEVSSLRKESATSRTRKKRSSRAEQAEHALATALEAILAEDQIVMDG